MTFFASLALVFVLVVRPQEIWPWLGAFRLLDVFTGLAVTGTLFELGLRRQRHVYTPQLPFLGGFLVVAYLATALSIGAARGISETTNRATIPAIFMLAVMYGARTLPRLKGMLWLLVALAALTSLVAAHQGSMPPQCVERVVTEDGSAVPDPATATGRSCGRATDCREEGLDDVDWDCERLGMFKTISTQRRVRWRGQLDDPNELSVFIAAVFPLLFVVLFSAGVPGVVTSPPRSVRVAIALVLVALGLWAVILSQSRGGQLVVGVVFAIYFVSRFGKAGIIAALVFALPVLLLGGRDDAEADDSSRERMELLYEGISLVFEHPFRGVGILQFADRVNSSLHLTAHNSYLLAAAELGFPGLFLWSGLVWTSVKIPLQALRTAALSAELRSFAMALVVSFCGMIVGIFFLSFTYKQLLFVWFGLSGAFYGIIRDAEPTLEVRVGWKDLVGLAIANAAVIGGLYVYTRARAGG